MSPEGILLSIYAYSVSGFHLAKELRQTTLVPPPYLPLSKVILSLYRFLSFHLEGRALGTGDAECKYDYVQIVDNVNSLRYAKYGRRYCERTILE